MSAEHKRQPTQPLEAILTSITKAPSNRAARKAVTVATANGAPRDWLKQIQEAVRLKKIQQQPRLRSDGWDGIGIDSSCPGQGNSQKWDP